PRANASAGETDAMTDMTCEMLAEKLGALLEDELPLAERKALELHAGGCDRCGPLLAGLRGIVREASALPELTPSRDLWSGIAARIEAPVVSLDAGPKTHALPRGLSWRTAAAAAAILVALTAVTTWQLAGNDAAAPERVAEVATPALIEPTRDSAPRGTTQVVAAEESRSSTSAPSPARSPASRQSPPAATVRNATAMDAVGVYDREIGSLRDMLDTRRSELDTETVRILEENLGVIDRAIEQSRQALARDPNSTFLVDHLNSALGRKVQLLRTATLIPSSS
ncbi:MAG TPA: zf-HC2 domain-containing protein, partial [Gemmatimonadaceae bacterium]|nr:zf-HC2 domain-containing protein [Gemmatimonadaceae bacterium]